MPMSTAHDIEHLRNVDWRQFSVEEIAHAVHEHAARPLPVQRVLEHVRLQGDLESAPVIVLSHRLQAMCETFGVAELASGADLRASGHRVPRRIGPFNG